MNIEPNDILKRAEQIEDLISSNRLEQAIKRLLDFVRDFANDSFYKKQVILLSANIIEMKNNQMNNILSYETICLERNRLIMSMLGLVEQITEQTV